MSNKRFFLLAIFSLLAGLLKAATVDTITIYSASMHKNTRCVVIMPSADKKKGIRYPVVYLLHGYSGNYANWVNKVPIIKEYADEYKLMIVCPDGGFSSWYLDSPVDPSMRYETLVAREIPAYIDAHYPTIPARQARAITGLSMGGYGGLLLAFHHADTFGACGSMSGGVDLNESRTRFDVIKRVGDTSTYADNWEKYSIRSVVEHYPKDSLSILIDCGMDDIFYRGNIELHRKMLQWKIPHDYIERPGKHDWDYWSNAVQFQLFYFNNYFKKRAVSGR